MYQECIQGAADTLMNKTCKILAFTCQGAYPVVREAENKSWVMGHNSEGQEGSLEEVTTDLGSEELNVEAREVGVVILSRGNGVYNG